MIIEQNTLKDILNCIGSLDKICSNLRQQIADIKPEKPEKKLSDYTIDQLLEEVKNRVSAAKPKSDHLTDSLKDDFIKSHYLPFDDTFDVKDVLTVAEVSNPKNITLPYGQIHSSSVFDYFKHEDGSVHTYDKNGTYVQHGSVFRVSNDSDGWKLIEKYKSKGDSFRYIYRCPRISYKLARAGSCGVKKKYGKVVDVYYK